MTKTYEEINEKIKTGRAVVVTAEEMIDVVRESGAKKAAQKVDVVTTGTFGPMCSSGALFNVAHTTPRMKMQHVFLNGVPAYAGIAAVDFYVGAGELREGDPLNKVFPGRFEYGGGHVIEDLVRGKEVHISASGYGTDCYPRKYWETKIKLSDFNSAFLLNPRNSYQNYNVAVNKYAKRPIYTYMGILRPRLGNASYSSAGQLSPLLNDPYYRTIGPGTRVFLGGAAGWVLGPGTQHDPNVDRNDLGVPTSGAGNISVTGDMKKMSADFLRGVSITGYGASLAVGIGIPIPILDEEMAVYTAVRDEDITAPVVDYSVDYHGNTGRVLAQVSYAELKSGQIDVNGKTVDAAPLSSYPLAKKIAETLKEWISSGGFLLGKPAETLPSARK